MEASERGYSRSFRCNLIAARENCSKSRMSKCVCMCVCGFASVVVCT